MTAHFSRREFRDKRRLAFLDPPCRLVAILEAVRAQTGAPLRIVSGYRTPETNREVGGAVGSRHLKGDAVDIPPGRCTEEFARRCGATGIGIKDGWVVHLDTRPGPVTVWTY